MSDANKPTNRQAAPTAIPQARVAEGERIITR